MHVDFSLESAFRALAGGILIGSAAVIFLLFNGRISGISGITRKTFNFSEPGGTWRLAFVLGLISSGLIFRFVDPEFFSLTTVTPVWKLGAAGILVGFGTAHAHGCTSGHGVCGVARLSKESIVATLTFMATALVTVFLFRHFGGLT